MIELPFTPQQVYRARVKANKLGELYGSITKGEGNFAGFLGEIALVSFLNKTIKGNVRLVSGTKGKNKYNHDIVLNESIKIECKTKRRKVDPLPFYDASIAKTSCHQKPDLYAFLSITFKEKNPRSVWLCGIISPEDFFSQAEFIKKNTWDRSNGFRCKMDMYNLSYEKLSNIESLINTGKNKG